jgi:hypothetical protein
MKYYLLLLVFLVPLFSEAQKKTTVQKKEPLHALCPLIDAKEVTEKLPYSLGKEAKIILSSSSDTTVKAGVAGTITNVQQDEEKKWIVVLEYKTYYLWYSGISRLAVRADQKIKAGDPIGYITPGGKIELHVFDFETPVEPKAVLDCKF